MTLATFGGSARTRPGHASTGARWLLVPPGVLLLLGLLGPIVVTVGVAIRDNGVVGTVTNPLADQLVVRALWTTLWMALVVTVATWAIALVFTLAIAMSPRWLSATLFGILFATLWISLLVRTYGWLLVLQPNGALDQIGKATGLTTEGFGLFQTMPGLIPPMVHIMLPYMVLPLYGSLRQVDPAQLRAARSLGGSETRVLWRLVLPSLRAGSWAGILLVFIMSLGFYVTPAFLGGPGSQVIATIIGIQFSRLDNLGLTAAIGTLLLIVVIALYLLADRLFKISQQWERG